MPDLVIGGRRSGFPRPWRAGAIALGMLGVAVIVAWFIYRRSVAYDVPAGEITGEISSLHTAPGALPTLIYGTSSLSWTGGIPVLHANGDAHAIGAAHGRLLAPWIAPVVAAAAPSITATVSDEGLFGGWTHNMRLRWRWRFVDEGLAESDRRMAAGLTRGAAASGVEVDYDAVLRDQAVLDVGSPSSRTGEAEHHSLAHSLTIIATQQQAPARLWIGRIFALPGIDDGGEAAIPIVQIVKPTGLIAWASVGWPGQLGVVTGVNAEGIAVFVDPVRTADVRPTRAARPIALLARAVLEQAKTLDEAIKLIQATETLGAGVMVVVDGTSGNWVIVERTPSKAILERKSKLHVFGDVLTTNALAQDPENDRARRMLPTMARIDRAAKLTHLPLPDVFAMATVLRDQRALDDSVRPPGHRNVIDEGRAVHTAILDPSSLELWVADPHAAGRFRAFDLRHELRGEGDRPAPPADLPADPTVELDRLANLVAARASIREARGYLGARDYVRASEACARALVRVPQLPEALEVDALVAQARGDLVHARASFQAWLDGIPDDPHGEERARALLAR
ncbi:MAG: C45 family autoproteolytic acyltransferase/hydrolase [Proteobacteria bacterium]|nr:C45 family autoproteolytic acyltransferase/hydrolase [Pseudomonadota bacterium]